MRQNICPVPDPVHQRRQGHKGVHGQRRTEQDLGNQGRNLEGRGEEHAGSRPDELRNQLLPVREGEIRARPRLGRWQHLRVFQRLFLFWLV